MDKQILSQPVQSRLCVRRRLKTDEPGAVAVALEERALSNRKVS